MSEKLPEVQLEIGHKKTYIWPYKRLKATTEVRIRPLQIFEFRNQH